MIERVGVVAIAIEEEVESMGAVADDLSSIYSIILSCI